MVLDWRVYSKILCQLQILLKLIPTTFYGRGRFSLNKLIGKFAIGLFSPIIFFLFVKNIYFNAGYFRKNDLYLFFVAYTKCFFRFS